MLQKDNWMWIQTGNWWSSCSTDALEQHDETQSIRQFLQSY